LVLGSAAAAMADSVRVTLKPGMPLGGLSVDAAQILVSRVAKGSYREIEIDRYFASIQAQLEEIGPGEFCTQFAPDVPRVSIQIELGGSSRTLECTVSTGTSAPHSTARDLAFNRILDLTIEQARKTLRK
jgi:hypothetical protein